MLVRKMLATAMATAALSTAFVATDDTKAHASKGCEVNPGIGKGDGGVYANALGECDAVATNLTLQVYMTRSSKKVGTSISESETYAYEVSASHAAVSNPKGKQEFCVASFLYRTSEIVDKRGDCDVY